MTQTGTTFTNRAGEEIIFRQTAHDTNGSLLEVEVKYRPDAPPPPAHYHPFQEEHFHVLEGAIQTTIGDQTRTYLPGEEFIIPAGVSHAMHNSSAEPGRVLWKIRPALQTESLFEMLWGLASEGKTNKNGVPKLFQLAVLLHTYNREFRLSKPPYMIQRVIWALVATIGRWRGYRSRYGEIRHIEAL